MSIIRTLPRLACSLSRCSDTMSCDHLADQHRPAPPSFSANQMHPANVGLMLWPRRNRAQHWLNVSCFRVAYLIDPPQYYWLDQCWYNAGSPRATLSYHKTNLHTSRICWDKIITTSNEKYIITIPTLHMLHN